MPEKRQVLISRLVMIGMGAIGLFVGMRLTNLISTIMAALSLMTPLAILMIGFFLLPPKFSRKSTCWWSWGMGSAAYLACTFINPAWKIAGQVIYTTLVFTVLGYIISLLVDQRLAKKIGYVEKVK
ncbi:hypothetical protein SDC9_137903 [bioreactor metagenome]|uniref:Uncharacterized protein n=1 Tax=bioreactor metagenome TaxID=1076179 RepID=A0A645DND6_9ZZZZ